MESNSQDFVISSCLDRLKLYAQRPSENEDQIKSLTTKLVTRMKLQEKLYKELSSKCSIGEHIVLFLSLLQGTENAIIIGNVISILQNLLQQKSCRKNCLMVLLANDAQTTLIKILPILTKDMVCPEHVLPDLFFIMAKLARRDPKFAIKTRCGNGLQSMMLIMKAQVRHTLLLRYLIQITKTCVANATNCNIMVKEGLVPVLVEILNCIGRKPTLLLKLTLETISLVTKHGSNVGKLIRCGGIQKILHIIEQWTKYDVSNRKKICLAGLTVLSHVADLRYGQKAISDIGGIQILYQLCLSFPRPREYDRLLNASSSIIQKCLPAKALPLATQYGPYSFPVPSSKIYPSVINLKKNSAVHAIPSDGSKQSQRITSSSDEDKDETASETDDSEQSEDSIALEIGNSKSELSKEEIGVYKKYFSELEDNSQLLSYPIGAKSLQISSFSSDQNFFGLSQTGSMVEGVAALAVSNEAIMKKNRSEIYQKLSSNTRHVAIFSKLAHPDLQGTGLYPDNEPLHDKDPYICRTRLLENLRQWMNPVEYPSIPVYDLDELNATTLINPYQVLDNDDELRIGERDGSVQPLKFESRFESGNLRRALQVGHYEYELILNPDINSMTHYQWFYFEVSNMDAVFPYTFHIINCEKTNSQFNFGMKPLMYSVKETMLGCGGWKRFGSNICYYKNIYQRECNDPNKKSQKYYFTLTFTVIFPHRNDVCYFAYHYPYTYTMLQTDIILWTNLCDKDSIYLSHQELCKSLNGNSVPVLTITSRNQAGRFMRPFIFLTGRVHPGESNSSWVMRGTIDFLLSDESSAQMLRDAYIFKIVPMLNPDGVINGCHRCDLTAEDLNRCWRKPCPNLQPTIYNTKALLQYLYCNSKTPAVYCDYHGHSRKKNIFLYGCCNSQSWCSSDREKPDSGDHEIIPHLLKNFAPAFSLENCVFTVDKNRETTARVTAWREFGITKSYTMESSYCGCDQGRYKGMHIGIKHLQEMGIKFCQALCQLNSSQASSTSLDRFVKAANSSSDGSGREGDYSTDSSSDTESESDQKSKATSAEM